MTTATQPSLFDHLAAQEAAIAKMEDHNLSWVARAVKYVAVVARAQDYLTTDDVWPLIPAGDDGLGHDRAIGPVMRRAKKEGYIGSTGQTTPCHCGRHRMPIRVWRSLLRKGSE